MDYKTYRKYSTTLKASEFRSYGRNKMEDRKLALHNDGVDKSIERRRKSFVSEKHEINKHFQDKVSKTTPSLEHYLQRSHTKYDAWKLREQERLDRRYRGLYKSYLKEYSDLKLDDIANLSVRKLSTSSDTSISHVIKNEHIDDAEKGNSEEMVFNKIEINPDQLDGKDDNSVTNNLGEDEVNDTITSLDQMSLGMKRNKTSSVTEPLSHPISDRNSRRFSTGGILFQDERKICVTNIPKYGDSDFNSCGASSAQADTPSIITGDKNDLSERRGSKGDKSDTIQSTVITNKKTKRRASLQKTPKLQVPRGVRLDRRSTLANIDIAVQYGN